MKETRTTIQGDRPCAPLWVVRKPALPSIAATAIRHGIGSFRISDLTGRPAILVPPPDSPVVSEQRRPASQTFGAGRIIGVRSGSPSLPSSSSSG